MTLSFRIFQVTFVLLFLCPGKIKAMAPAYDVVTLKVLVIFDSKNTASISSSHLDAEKYASIYWNSVQQSFFQTQHPRIEIAVTGVVTFNSSNEEPIDIFEEGSPSPLGPGYFSLFTAKIDEASSLEKLGKWLFLHWRSLPVFDIAFLHTRYNVGTLDENGIWQDNTPGGVKELGAACYRNDEEEYFGNVALIEDYAPRYVNVITAVQMVATLLGVPFDGSAGAETCSAEDAYLMGMPRVHENSRKFSNCSLTKLQNIARKFPCLRNTSASVPKYLVYDNINMSLDDACKTLYGENSTASPMVPYLECNVGLCSTSNPTAHPYYFHPPEGIACGRDKVCVHSFCIPRSSVSKKLKKRNTSSS